MPDMIIGQMHTMGTVPDSLTRLEDKARIVAFHFFYDRILADEVNSTLRFAKAIIYSSRRLTKQKRKELVEWYQRNRGKIADRAIENLRIDKPPKESS